MKKKLNIFVFISVCFSVFGLIGTIFSKNKDFYLLSPIALDILLALVFLISAAIGKPLIRFFAEYSVGDAFPESLKALPMYKNAWTILTVIWGLLSLSQALLRIYLFYNTATAVYFGISAIYGNISSPLMLLFSFWFPKQYWKSKGYKREEAAEAVQDDTDEPIQTSEEQ